jgi:4-carboxymuconolactone decarboxylase
VGAAWPEQGFLGQTEVGGRTPRAKAPQRPVSLIARHCDIDDEETDMDHGRLPWLGPEDLNEEQQVLYRSILGSPRNTNPRRIPLTDPEGRLHGPFNSLLFNPELGNSLQNFGSHVRYGTGLSDRAREIAILEVARAQRSNVEWLSHADVARVAGMTDHQLTALTTGSETDGFSDEEAVVRDLAQSLVATRDISDELYEHAVAQLGQAVVVDVVILVGYYELLALVLRVSRTPLPTGFEPTFP